MINNILVRTFVRILDEDGLKIKCAAKLDSPTRWRVGFGASDPLRPQLLEANLFW